MAANLPVLLVDDEQDILFSASIALRNTIPNEILTLSDSTQVMPLLEKQEVALIILDLQMPVMTGQELLQRIAYEYPQIPVIIMTAATALDVAVGCMKQGAVDYLVKPVGKDMLVTSALRILEVHRLRREVNSLKRHLLDGKLQDEAAFAPIITRSKKILALFQYLESISGSNQPLLISGETGVGKELFSRAVHKLSGRSGHFVAVNVAGLDDPMFSDTLFGHRKGAYTGADQSREGLIARGAGGTLFLDEIGELNAASQVKLLRLLQENEYYPLGSDVAKKCDARIIVATNRDLRQSIKSGEFRKDLYYRLCGHSCHIPPLRDRPEDLPLLLDHFLTKAAADFKKKKPTCPDELVFYLATYHFPGNIRELETMVYDAVAQHTSRLLSVASFKEKIEKNRLTDEPEVVASEPPEKTSVVFSRFPTLKEAEEELISRALALARGNQGAAALLLGMTRQALNNRLTRKQRS